MSRNWCSRVWRHEHCHRDRRAVFAAGLFGFGTYWLYTSIHHFGQVPIWLTLILQAGLIAIMAVYSAALGWLANRFWPTGAARQFACIQAAEHLRR